MSRPEPVAHVGWRCAVCHASNVDLGPCRVCRADPALVGASHGDDDPGAIFTLLRVLPTVAFLAIGGLAASELAPDGSRWTSAATRSGWSDEVRTRRQDELLLAAGALRDLLAELQAAAIAGEPLPAGWPDRLSLIRREWRVYGDSAQSTGLGESEIAVATIVEDLASLRFQVDAGLPKADVETRLANLQLRATRAEATLSDAP